MNALRDILEQWSDAWQYPELAALLAGADEDVDAAALAKAVIEGIAFPRSRCEAVVSLLRVGEFRAAARMMQTEGFRSGLEADDHAEFSRSLDNAKRQALEATHARAAALDARAHRVGLMGGRPKGVDEACNERASNAEALLGRWEKEIRRQEDVLSRDVRKSLEAALGGTDLETSSGDVVWKEAVERCLHAREYEAARFLLDAGPAATTPDQPMLVPRRPRWPWEESVPDVLNWLRGTHPAPPEFHAGWRHDPDDEPAARLVELLGRICDSGIPNVAAASEFSDALDSFLGREKVPHEVAVRGNWFLTRLHSPVDPRLPCLGVRSSGVRLWLPRSADTPPPDESGHDEVTLCFQPDSATACPAQSIGFDARVLLGLLADRRHRRANYLRELGSRVDLELAIPADLAGLDLPSMDPAAVRVYAAWLLDIVNVEVIDPAAVDVIVYYGGAQPLLVLHLIRALLASTASRRSAVGQNEVRRAWRTTSFRDAARSCLLGPMEDHPLLRAVLGAALFEGSRPGGSLTAEDVCFALDELWGRELPEEEAVASLNRLADLGLVDRQDAIGRYRLPTSGISSIILDAISDVESYVQQALEST